MYFEEIENGLDALISEYSLKKGNEKVKLH